MWVLVGIKFYTSGPPGNLGGTSEEKFPATSRSSSACSIKDNFSVTPGGFYFVNEKTLLRGSVSV
jgi:hypothetical protein